MTVTQIEALVGVTPLSGDLETSVSARALIFDKLLSEIGGVDARLRHLWLEAYTNAMSDRLLAYIAYTDLLPKILANRDNHGLFGDKLTKYMERMSRANDQLISLSKQIAEASVVSSNVDPDTIYSQMV